MVSALLHWADGGGGGRGCACTANWILVSSSSPEGEETTADTTVSGKCAMTIDIPLTIAFLSPFILLAFDPQLIPFGSFSRYDMPESRRYESRIVVTKARLCCARWTRDVRSGRWDKAG